MLPVCGRLFLSQALCCGHWLQQHAALLVQWYVRSDLRCLPCINYVAFCCIEVWDFMLHWSTWCIIMPFLYDAQFFWWCMQSVREAFVALPAMYETEYRLPAELFTNSSEIIFVQLCFNCTEVIVLLEERFIIWFSIQSRSFHIWPENSILTNPYWQASLAFVKRALNLNARPGLTCTLLFW